MRADFVKSLLVAALIAPAIPAAARADRIDGDWCHDALSLHISGPALRTPAGHDITGDYARHAFRYTVPKDEPDADAEIILQLLNDEEMTLIRPSAADGTEPAAEHWTRCQPIS